jgi:hypothetical protein
MSKRRSIQILFLFLTILTCFNHIKGDSDDSDSDEYKDNYSMDGTQKI